MDLVSHAMRPSPKSNVLWNTKRDLMDLQLTGKVAIVTGSSRGLGRASARALAVEGCQVTLCARNAEPLRAAAAEIGQSVAAADRVLAVAADVSTPAGVADVVNQTLARYERIDILVNNVGKAAGTDILGTSDAEWQSAFDQTLYPAIRMSREVVPHMRRTGGGVITMITSIYGREAGGRMTYNAVKAAEISLAKALSQQLARDNIRVNSVAPGSILFEGGSWWKRQQEDPDGIAEFIRRELPFGRFGRPEEIGAVVAFLASPLASWISGACIPVDGGQGRSNI
jgi:3-oxoacyl-[acyl-carrier protein] reductase